MLRKFRGRSGPGRPRDDRAAVGRCGEDLALRHLRRQGFRILDRRYRTRFGEIDLVAEEAGEIVFVEVKTRRGAGCGRPEESIDARKRRRLVRLARAYLQHRRLDDRPCRFDVVSVRLDPGRAGTIDHLRHAFTADGYGA